MNGELQAAAQAVIDESAIPAWNLRFINQKETT